MKTEDIDSTRSRLIRFRGRYPEISRLCSLSYSWLSKFARGVRGQRPSFEVITRLRSALDQLEQVDGDEQGGAQKVHATHRRPSKNLGNAQIRTGT